MGKNLLLWLIIAAVLLTVFNNFNVKPEPETLSYSEFIQQVRSDEVLQVEIDGLIIDGMRRSGEAFQVVRPGIDDQKLLGIVSIGDLNEADLSTQTETIRYLEQYLTVR